MASRPGVGLVKSQTEVKNQQWRRRAVVNGWGMFRRREVPTVGAHETVGDAYDSRPPIAD
jgi:hypothetical protein